jgi:hypothetical protein
MLFRREEVIRGILTTNMIIHQGESSYYTSADEGEFWSSYEDE